MIPVRSIELSLVSYPQLFHCVSLIICVSRYHDIVPIHISDTKWTKDPMNDQFRREERMACQGQQPPIRKEGTRQQEARPALPSIYQPALLHVAHSCSLSPRYYHPIVQYSD